MGAVLSLTEHLSCSARCRPENPAATLANCGDGERKGGRVRFGCAGEPRRTRLAETGVGTAAQTAEREGLLCRHAGGCLAQVC